MQCPFQDWHRILVWLPNVNLFNLLLQETKKVPCDKFRPCAAIACLKPDCPDEELICPVQKENGKKCTGCPECSGMKVVWSFMPY